jgi:hypothetical protein
MVRELESMALRDAAVLSRTAWRGNPVLLADCDCEGELDCEPVDDNDCEGVSD